MAVLDDAGVVIAENRAWKGLVDRIKGFPAAALGENYLEVCAEAGRGGNRSATALEAALKSADTDPGEPPMVEVAVGKGPGAVWLDAYVTHYTNESRSGAVVTLEDVSSHKRVENALADSRRFIAKVLDTVPNIVYVYDLVEQRSVYVNDQVGGLLGYSPKEIQAMGDQLLPQLLHPYDKGQMREHLSRLASTGSDEVFDVEYRLKHRERGWRWFASRDVVFERDENGKARQILGYARDVTQRKEDELRIETYQSRLRSVAREVGSVEEEERRRIAADLHDVIGQGLIALSLQMAALKANDSLEDVREKIGELEEQVSRIVQETRGLTFEISPPVLYELGLSAAIRWLTTKIEADHGLHVEVDAADRMADLEPEVSALLFRGVRELLMNVVKHAETKTAKVRLCRERNALLVEVHDRGAGFRSSRLDVVDEKDAGFGLFSLRERLAAIDGTLEVQSDPGIGTTVVMRVWGRR